MMSKHLALITKLGLIHGKIFLLPQQRCVGKILVTSISTSNSTSSLYKSKQDGRDKSTSSEDSDSLCELKDYDVFMKNTKTGIRTACKALMDILGINESIALHAAQMYPALQKIPCLEIMQNYEILLEMGISDQSIKNNIWLLGDAKEVIKIKARYIQLLPLQLKHAIPFFNLKVQELRILVALIKLEAKDVPNVSRIHYLSEKLQCSLTTMCNLLVKHKYLLKISFNRIQNIIELLLEHGVTPENIIHDLWVFRYKVNTVSMRIEKAVEAEINPIKPWVVRCPESTLNKIFSRKLKRRNALAPYENTAELLCAKLQCTQQEIEAFLDANPALSKMDPLKLKIVIEFLLEKDYKPEHLIQTPRLLQFGYKTILTRYSKLKQLNMKPSSLKLLMKQTEEVEPYIEKNDNLQKKLDQTNEKDNISSKTKV